VSFLEKHAIANDATSARLFSLYKWCSSTATLHYITPATLRRLSCTARRASLCVLDFIDLMFCDDDESTWWWCLELFVYGTKPLHKRLYCIHLVSQGETLCKTYLCTYKEIPSRLYRVEYWEFYVSISATAIVSICQAESWNLVNSLNLYMKSTPEILRISNLAHGGLDRILHREVLIRNSTFSISTMEIIHFAVASQLAYYPSPNWISLEYTECNKACFFFAPFHPSLLAGWPLFFLNRVSY
jgi:hypothetical protein